MEFGFAMVFMLPPVLFAFVLGFAIQRPLIAVVAAVALLASMLMLLSGYGPIAMAPFLALTTAMLIVPAALAAVAGRWIRNRLTREI